MTTAERTKPRLPHHDPGPQCCVPMVDAKCWAEHYIRRRHRRAELMGWDYMRCMRGSSAMIDGQHYCGQHGGQLALALLLGEEVDWGQSYDTGARD